MKNIFHIFWRDVKRILKVPPAWLVVIFLCILPSLYAWFNIVGFWDPYNNTGHLRVCVTNEDVGVHDDLIGDMRIGGDIEDALRENTSFDWVFTTREDALEQVRTGQAYASFIIPQSFSKDIASLFSGNLEQPKLEYYVNEKMSPVSPKITDTGADILDTTINDTFISVVSSTVASVVHDAVLNAETDMDSLHENAVSKIDSAAESIDDARSVLQEVSDNAQEFQGTIDSIDQELCSAQNVLFELSDDLSGASRLASQTNESLMSFLITTGMVLDESTSLASQASIKANTAVQSTTGAIIESAGSINATITQAQLITNNLDYVIDSLESVVATLPDGDKKDALKATITSLHTQNETTKEVLKTLSQTASGVTDSVTAIGSASDTVNMSVQTTLDAVTQVRSVLSNDTLPVVNQGMTSLTSSVQSLSVAASNQAILVNQALMVLKELRATLELSVDSLSKTDAVLGSFSDSLVTLRTDLHAIATADGLASLTDGDSIDPEQIASFMLSPTEVTTEELYPINVYGSAMAPLFINLTLWIGVFMLMVIFKLEVDNTGLRKPTIAQRFFGRGILLAILAICQAVICCIGCLVIGVQVVNIPMFFLTAIICSLAYLSIQYSLSATFQHVGKALCIILVFVQIPGATGLYPIEMTPEFFRVVYPLFPFTYGINAIRETICGFYGMDWLHCVGVLALFFIAFIVIGVWTRPYVTNLNRLFAREIEESDIINGETVELPEQHFKRSELIQLLSNREEYRILIRSRAKRFMSMYPRLIKTFYSVATVVPVVVTSVYLFLGAEKVVIMVSLLVWGIAVITAAIVIEYFKDHIARQISFDNMSDEQIKDLYVDQNDIHELGEEVDVYDILNAAIDSDEVIEMHDSSLKGGA